MAAVVTLQTGIAVVVTAAVDAAGAELELELELEVELDEDSAGTCRRSRSSLEAHLPVKWLP